MEPIKAIFLGSSKMFLAQAVIKAVAAVDAGAQLARYSGYEGEMAYAMRTGEEITCYLGVLSCEKFERMAAMWNIREHSTIWVMCVGDVTGYGLSRESCQRSYQRNALNALGVNVEEVGDMERSV
jgi:hypothetical protein